MAGGAFPNVAKSKSARLELPASFHKSKSRPNMKNPFKPLFTVQLHRSTLAVVTVTMCGLSALSAQTNGTWSVNASGDWNSAANWTSSQVASGAGAIADFSTLNIDADRTVNLDAPVTIGALTTGDLTTASHNWIFSGGGLLTLNNGASAPVITVTNQNTFISAPLAGTNGFTKAGAGVLYLTGNNSALQGTLSIQNVAATNNNGVVLRGNDAIGGITSVNIDGTLTSGGFFQLDGGVTLPNTVGITLNSPGGNATPPGGIRSTGTASQINTINGTINVTLSTARISNNSAQRLDINGVISGTGTNILFRNSVNEGIRLTGANTYTGETINSGGILWFDSSTALPTSSLLSISASDPGTVQFSGSFTRALGSSAGQVRFSQLNANSSTRVMGLSARGGDLTVNFGGASAEVPFNNFTTNVNGLATAINTNTLWLNNSTATHKITVVNPLNLNGADRSFQVDANVAELSGGITGTNNITKTGTGTLVHTPPLDVSVARTITVSGGTFNIAGAITGSAVLTKAGSSPLVASGGINVAAARAVAISAGTLEASGGINGGNFLFTKNAGGGALVLSGPSTWTGGLATGTTGTTNFGVVRVSHAEGLGPAATAKTIQMRGNNQGVSILELTGGVTVDANKILAVSGKSFYNGANVSGSPISLRSAVGSNTWSGNFAIAETGGAYGIEALTGATLTLGASPATTNTIRNSGTGDTRVLNTFGAGDFIFNSKIAVNGTSKIGINANGGGTITIPRGDNDFDNIANLYSGTVDIVKLTNNGTASSIGTASSFNLGGTLRYSGAGDSANRTLGLLPKGGTLDSSGTGPISLTSTTLSHQTGVTTTSTAAFANGATTLTVAESGGISVGATVTGTNIPVGTTVIATNPSARTITLSQGTSAASASSVALTFGGQSDINRTLTLAGTNTGENQLAAELSNPAGTGVLGVTKTGPGKWVLSGTTKTNTGALDVQAGILELRNSGFPASTANVAAGSTLILNNLSSTLSVTGAVTLNGKIIASIPGEPTAGTYNVIQYGSISGSGSISTAFRGSANLGPTTGTITIGEGIAIKWTGAANTSWDVNNSVNWQDGTANPETFRYLDSVTFDSVGAAQPNVAITGDVRPGSVIVNEETVDYTLGGAGFISGSGSLTKSGAAALILNTANTFTGNVAINAGTIRIGNGQALGANGKTINIASGGMLDLNGALNANRDYQAVIAGTGVGNAGAIVNSLSDINFGFTSLTLAGNASIGGNFRWDVRPITAGTGLVDLGGYTLTKTGSNMVALVDGTLSSNGAINVDQGILGITRMVVSGTGSVNVNSGAILRFENNTTGSWNKPIKVDSGTISVLGSSYILDAVVTAENTATFNVESSRTLSLTQPVGGTGGLTMGPGNGAMVLRADSTYAGPTSINAGTLQIGTQINPAALAPGAVSLAAGANLRINRGDTAYSLDIAQISGAGRLIIGQNAAAVSPDTTWESRVTLNGSNAGFTGNVLVESGALRILGSGSLGAGPKTVTLTNGTNGRPQLQLDGTAGDIILAPDISFFTSNLDLARPALHNIAGNNQIGGNITLTSGGGNTAFKVASGSLTLNGNIASNTSGRSLLLGGNTGASGIINGIISDGTNPLAIVKSEANTWTLAGTNTYSGTTTVSGGTLLINGNQSASSGAVTVNNGATLGGTGSSGAVVTVNTGGTIAPGATSVESLETGTVNLADGATLAIDIHTNSGTADQLVVTGNVDLTGTVNLVLNDLGSNVALPPGTKLVIADYSGIWNEADVLTFGGSPVANESTITLGANTFIVDYSDATLGESAITLSIAGTSNPYLGWANSYSLTGGDIAPTADPDNDGLDNGIEFVIGSNPTTNTPAGNRPAASVIGGNLVFTFKRSDDSESFDVFVEHGTTLATWPGQIAIPAGAYSDANVTVTNNDPGLDDVTVSIPIGTDEKKFARLRADIPFTP
jgi:fibronectin-binding autotransporter adhesin